MAKNYSRISVSERGLIEQHLKTGKSQAWIAKALNRNKSSISREIRKDYSSDHYSAKRAQRVTEQLKARNRRKGKVHGPLEAAVLWYLTELQCSPLQISGRLKREYPQICDLHVSPETIYKYIYNSPLRENITSCLRRGRKRRRRKQALKRGGIRNKVPISMRPDLTNRQEFGHWEGDLIVGKEHQSAMLTLVERSSRYTIIVPLISKDSKSVVNAAATALIKLPKHLRKSLTYDQGSEMAEHAILYERLKLPVYFADAGKPQQRGTNENTNGLIRQYFPKGSDLRQFSESQVLEVQEKLNKRPKTVLNYATPLEIFAAAEADPGLRLSNAIAS